MFLSIELLMILILGCIFIKDKYNDYFSITISIAFLAAYLKHELIFLFVFAVILNWFNNNYSKMLWLIVAILLFAEKYLIYFYGDTFKISGLSFFLITYTILLTTIVDRKSVNILSFFFPHVLAGPVIFEKIYNESPSHHRLTSALWAYALGRILLFCSDILYEQFKIALESKEIILFSDSYIYLMSLFSNFFGYSLVAIAYAWLMGFNISYNFNSPGLANSPSSFWRRWHISLTTFMRYFLFEFLFKHFTVRYSLIFTLLISGLWHGLGLGYFLWSLYFAMLAIIWPRRTNMSYLQKTCFAITFLIISLPGWFLFALGSLGIDQIKMLDVQFTPGLREIGIKGHLVLLLVTLLYFMPIDFLFRIIGVVKKKSKGFIEYIEVIPYNYTLIIISILCGYLASEGIGSVTEFIYEAF